MQRHPDPRPKVAEAERRLLRGVAFAFAIELVLFFLAGAALMLAGPALSRLWEAWPW